MKSSVETMGLRVESMTPAMQSIGVDVHEDIRIRFNSDLDTGSIIGNLVVLSDPGLHFVNLASMDRSQYETVQGKASYDDRTIIFSPTNPLAENRRYLVFIRAGGLTDVLGRGLATDFVGIFYTESSATGAKPTFLSPRFGTISSEIPVFTWGDEQTKAYTFQLSREETFETLLCDELLINNVGEYAKSEYLPSLNLTEGLYYARVKAVNGHWSDPIQFFIKREVQEVVSREDAYEDLFLGDLDASFVAPIEVLEMFPDDKSFGVSLKTNVVYIKMVGRIGTSDVDFENSYLYGSPFDEEDEDEPQGPVAGEWTLIYDEARDVSYLVFSPVERGV